MTGAPNIRFYAGVQLVAPNSHRIGSLCAISDKPRVLLAHEAALLQSLGEMVCCSRCCMRTEHGGRW